MPTGPAGARESTFTLYDGTRLHWTGSALEVTNNATPRSIQLQAPDARTAVQYIDTPTATLTPA